MNLTEEEKKLYNQLDDGIWATKGTRFLTYRKYKSIFNLLKSFNTIFSFLLIVIGIYKIGGFSFIDSNYDKPIDILLLILSIYIFSTSFYISTMDIKINRILKNATNLSYLLRKLKLVTNTQDLSNISDDYKKLEDELNHDYIDYKKWCNINGSNKHKNSCFGEIYYGCLWSFYSKFPLVLLILFIMTPLIYIFLDEIIKFFK